ncbi:MAG: LPS-assembly protein LptD [Prevotellaceae bacterium]|nr:LPS-assembly protein LptD [Prevotellaceae bacterium]
MLLFVACSFPVGVFSFAPGQALYSVSEYSSQADTSAAVQTDTISVLQKDTTGVLLTDSISVPATDTMGVSSADTAYQQKSSLAIPVFSSARDSTDFDPQEQIAYYYGDVTVTYGDLELKADYMEYNSRTRVVYAKGTTDSTGKAVGNPVMKDGGKTYAMERMSYNFSTGKAIISNVITQEGDGYLHGMVIKKMPDNSIHIKGGKYTTCDHEHPHFYLDMSKAKVLNSPKQTVFSFSYLVLEDVPLYPAFIPFGFVPDRPDRAGGLLFPTFVDEVKRGFALKDLGYYFVFGSHADLALTGSFYTLGSWSMRAVARYTKRYKYNGNLNFDYAMNVLGEKGSADYNSSSVYAIRWTHSMDPKMHPGINFSASVNYSAANYNAYQGQSTQQALQNTASSSISFRKTWDGTPFNLSVNLTHSQNMRDSSYALGLPNLTFTMNRIYPFKLKERVGKEQWLEKFAMTYGMTFDNKISFKERELGNVDFMDFMRNGMKHTFGLTLPPMTLLKYIQLTPSVSYGMNMYFQSATQSYNAETNKIDKDKKSAFETFGVTTDYSFSLAASTRLYGIFQFGRNSHIRAIRHMITPSVTASYRPEQGTAANGYREDLWYIDPQGKSRQQIYNIYDGQAYSPTARGRTAGMSFGLGNNVEMKVRSKADTITGERKIKVIDNLNFSGSYNWLADSMKLSNIGVSFNTTPFDKLTINGNMQFDPYKIHPLTAKRYNKMGMPRFASAGFSFGYSFRGGGNSETGKSGSSNSSSSSSSSSSANVPVPVHRYDPVTGEYVTTDWMYYADFNSPWSINFNYGYNYSVNYTLVESRVITDHKHNQTLGFSGQIQLTKAAMLRMNSGFDFKELTLTTTSFDLTYNLHCFEFVFNWVPTGRWQQWSFRINALSGALADLLKYDKTKSFWDN